MALRAGLTTVVVAGVASLGLAFDVPPAPKKKAAAEASAAAKSAGEGWTSLTNTAAWRGYKTQDVPAGWKVEGDTLTKEGKPGDILTKDQYGDFEMTFEWKVSPGGNAGIFYRATEEYDHVYWSAPEYQLLDDAGHKDGQSRLTAAGAAYALYPAPTGAVKAGGEWNTGRIVARGGHVEHWLNGVKTADYELWSPDWEAKVKASKFKDWANYGRAKKGYIAIQGDHEGMVALRNVRIRELR